MQAFASQRTSGKQKRFNQLLTLSSSWLFPQFSTLGTIIKSPLSGTKQAIGILARHNGKPSQRMAGIKSRCLPVAGLPTQHCQLQSTKTQHVAAYKNHDVSLMVGKHLRRQTKWPLLIKKAGITCLQYPHVPWMSQFPSAKHSSYLVNSSWRLFGSDE